MNDAERFALESMRFTASVMGNPEYIEVVRNVKQASDQRSEGIEKLNAWHAHHHKRRVTKQHNGPDQNK